MSSEILWCAVFLLLFVGCAIILWFFLDHVKKRLLSHKKEIFICADCWLLVFDFLAPSQLGLGIALISRRFDIYVDEHFKTRKWKLGKMRICHKIGENGTKQMQIAKSDGNPLPIPQNPLPNKVIGFRGILILYIDQNVIAFLRRFHRFFAVCSIYLDNTTANDRISEFFLLNIWPMFHLRDSIRGMYLNGIVFRRLRQMAPALFTDCPSLFDLSFDDGILPEFPIDDSANASDGQAVAKWLFTPHPNNVPNFLYCDVSLSMDQWSSTMEQFKTAFSNASSPIAFHILVHFQPSFPIDSVVPFDRINKVTGEKLILHQFANDIWLKRCPIAWDQRKWQNVINEVFFARQNPINILIRDGGFDDGLLDVASPGPSDQQQKCHHLDNIV